MTDTTQYVEHPCSLATHGWSIPAALTLPAAGEIASAILLVPGSLYSDVNGDYPSWNSFPHVYAHLARQLSARGHAVYRFAKLGPGTGSVAADAELSASVRNWGGRRLIATAAFDAMRRELAVRGLRAPLAIGAGHSEGSVVISQVATLDRAAELDGIVLLAGPSVGLLSIMREQIGLMTPPDQVAEATRRLDEVIAYIRRGDPVPAEFAAGPPGGATALATMPEEGRRYMRDTDATDPSALAAAMGQPALVVQGGADANVPIHHGERLRDALRARAGGSTSTQYLLVPGVSHMFKVVPSDVTGPAAFGYPGETDPRVAEGIDHWVRSLRKPR
jgi:pimeloyl-ACP methyl ester carboxylesterase